MTTKTSLLLSILAFSGGVTIAQGQGSASDDEAAIRLLEERGKSGVLNRDTLALMQVWSENFMVNAPANRVSPNRHVVFDLLRQGVINYSSFESTIEHVRIDGDLAIVMGAETVRPIGKAPLAGQIVRRRFTHVWRKESGGWRLIARHSNIIPSR
ncbi:MAG TPA: nuclear transport factor 2 family protein [Gemmatimonadales bacterium]|nr:nuclear transport factor 2 family protein [Gemmatimonadales bacterium]